MASPLDESVKGFVEDVFANETLLQSERKQFILSAMLSLEKKINNGTDRWGMSMQLAGMGKDARHLRKKNRKEEYIDDLDNIADGTTRSHIIEDEDVGC